MSSNIQDEYVKDYVDTYNSPVKKEKKTLKDAYVLLNEKLDKLHLLYNTSDSLLHSMKNMQEGVIDNKYLKEDEPDPNSIVDKFYNVTYEIDDIIAKIEENINEVHNMIE